MPWNKGWKPAAHRGWQPDLTLEVLLEHASQFMNHLWLLSSCIAGAQQFQERPNGQGTFQHGPLSLWIRKYLSQKSYFSLFLEDGATGSGWAHIPTWQSWVMSQCLLFPNMSPAVRQCQLPFVMILVVLGTQPWRHNYLPVGLRISNPTSEIKTLWLGLVFSQLLKLC